MLTWILIKRKTVQTCTSHTCPATLKWVNFFPTFLPDLLPVCVYCYICLFFLILLWKGGNNLSFNSHIGRVLSLWHTLQVLFAHSCFVSHFLLLGMLLEKDLSLPEIFPHPPTAVKTGKTNRKLSFWYVWLSLIAYLNGEGIQVVQHHVVGLWEQRRVTLDTKWNQVMTILCLCIDFSHLEAYCRASVIHEIHSLAILLGPPDKNA